MSMRGRRQPKRAALEFIYTGNGSATFDPAITTSKSTTIVWQTSDGQIATTTGTTHNFSYTPASGGPYRCTVRVAGGLGLVTAIDCRSDSIDKLNNLDRMRSCTSFVARDNTSLAVHVASIPRLAQEVNIAYCTAISGAVRDLPIVATGINAQVSSLVGNLADTPSGSQTVYYYSCTGITPGSIAHLNAIRDIRIYSMWAAYTAADSVDIVINSMWAARAAYTYSSGLSAQLGGTNPDPTGNIVAPVEGADWHEDTPGHWVPRTPGAKIYDLLNDVNSEGFPTWTSIAT
jgi:hypothetical protein